MGSKVASTVKAWRDAASLILVTEHMKVLLLKRGAKSTVFANTSVFPGGAFDPADAHVDWLTLLRENGHGYADWHNGADGLAAQAAVFASARRVPIFSHGIDWPKESPLLPEVALRICALRETFEECGLLLAADREGNRVPYDTWATPQLHLADWQAAVKKDGKEFLRLFSSLGLCPDLRSLHEWSNWLTPSSIATKRRFDTVFFLCCLPSMFEVRLDLAEMAGEHDWLSPREAIDQYYSNKSFSLSPPTIFELAKLAGHANSLQDLETFAQRRSRLGLERYFPVLAVGQKLAFTVHPGDFRYPSNPDFYSSMHLDVSQVGDEQLLREQPANRIYHAIDPSVLHVTPEGSSRPSILNTGGKLRLSCRGLQSQCGFRPPLTMEPSVEPSRI